MIMGKNTDMKAAISGIVREPDPKIDGEDYEARKAAYVPRPSLKLLPPSSRATSA